MERDANLEARDLVAGSPVDATLDSRCGSPCYQKIYEEASAEATRVTRGTDGARDPRSVSDHTLETVMQRANRRETPLAILQGERADSWDPALFDASTSSVRITRGVDEPAQPRNIYYTDGHQVSGLERDDKRSSTDQISPSSDVTPDGIRVDRRGPDEHPNSQPGASHRSLDDQIAPRGDPNPHPDIIHRCSGNCYQKVDSGAKAQPDGTRVTRGNGLVEPQMASTSPTPNADDVEATRDGIRVNRRCSGGCYQDIPGETHAQSDGTRVTRGWQGGRSGRRHRWA